MNARIAPLRSATATGSPPGRQYPLGQAAKTWAGEAGAATSYSALERRRHDRRQADLPTTLDTRKAGPDRRVAGRISVRA